MALLSLKAGKSIKYNAPHGYRTNEPTDCGWDKTIFSSSAQASGGRKT